MQTPAWAGVHQRTYQAQASIEQVCCPGAILCYRRCAGAISFRVPKFRHLDGHRVHLRALAAGVFADVAQCRGIGTSRSEVRGNEIALTQMFTHQDEMKSRANTVSDEATVSGVERMTLRM